MKQKPFVDCRAERVEPRVAADKFVVIGKLSAWQITNVRGEESAKLRDKMLLSLGYPGMEICKYQTSGYADMVQFAS